MPEQGDPNIRDQVVDAEMEDIADPAGNASTSRNPNDTSMDHDFTQSEAQPATAAAGGGGLAHHNRKDVTLREFLSKMDDYAPIVRWSDIATDRYEMRNRMFMLIL